MSKNSINLFFLIPIILLVLAPIISFPYGFYTLLRLIIFITSLFIVYNIYQTSKGLNEPIIIFIVMAVLYNPFIPVYMSDNKFASKEITKKNPLGDLSWLIGK